jgi:hypothetical protein
MRLKLKNGKMTFLSKVKIFWKVVSGAHEKVWEMDNWNLTVLDNWMFSYTLAIRTHSDPQEVAALERIVAAEQAAFNASLEETIKRVGEHRLVAEPPETIQ